MLKHFHREACEATQRLENQLRLLRGYCGDDQEELFREIDDALIEIRSALEPERKMSSAP